MTSPPRERMVVKSLPKISGETGWDWLPFQYGVQEPLVAVCKKAMVRYFTPAFAARSAGLSLLYASKYGANTCGGRALAAWAVPPIPRTRPAEAARVAIAVRHARSGLKRLMHTPGGWDGACAARRRRPAHDRVGRARDSGTGRAGGTVFRGRAVPRPMRIARPVKRLT